MAKSELVDEEKFKQYNFGRFGTLVRYFCRGFYISGHCSKRDYQLLDLEVVGPSICYFDPDKEEFHFPDGRWVPISKLTEGFLCDLSPATLDDLKNNKKYLETIARNANNSITDLESFYESIKKRMIKEKKAEDKSKRDKTSKLEASLRSI